MRELGLADAEKVATSLAGVAASGRNVILDLAGQEFVESSGLAALVRKRQHARHAGIDLQLAEPQQHVLQILAVIRLVDVFAVHVTPS